MASSKYSKYREMLSKLSSDGSSKTKTTANNYKARLEAGGVDVESAMDKRNILERALNLEKDQNFIFDLFEILNRPQQAVFNAWKSSQEGEDALKGAWEGLSGKEDVQFKEILKNYGMSDREGKLDLSDALGFAGDVFLDPMNLIPLAGFDEFSKALDAGSSFRQASKNLKTGSDLAMSAIGKGVKGTAKLADLGIEKALTKLDEVSGVVDTNGNVVKFKYTNPDTKNAADLIKKAVGTGDDVTNKVVGRLENYKQAKNDLSRMFKVSDNKLRAVLTGRAQNTLQDDARLKNITSYRKRMDDLSAYAKTKNLNVDDLAKDITLFDEAVGLDRNITLTNLWHLAKEGTLDGSDEVVNALEKAIEKDIPKNIRANPNYDVSVKINSDTGKIELGKDLLRGTFDIKPLNEDELLKIQVQIEEAMSVGNTKTVEKLTKKLNDNMVYIPYRYTDESLKRLKKFANLYKRDAKLRNIVDDIVGTTWKSYKPLNLTNQVSDVDKIVDSIRKVGNTSVVKPSLIDELNKNIDTTMGSNLSEKYNSLTNAGYLPHTLTPEAESVVDDLNKLINKRTGMGNTRILSERTRLGSIDEINADISKLLAETDNSNLSENLLAFKKSNAKFMEDNYFKAISNRYLEPTKSTTSIVKSANMANKILIDEAFGNTKEIIKLQDKLKNAEVLGDFVEVNQLTKQINELQNQAGVKFLTGSNTKVPYGYVQMSKDDLLRTFKKYQTLNKQVGIPTNVGSIIRSIERYSGNVAIDGDILRMLNIISDEKTYTGLSSVYNKFLNMFKKWKTTSPTFVLNAFLGNSSNLSLSGISMLEQAKYGETVLDIIQNGEKYHMAKLAGEVLDPKANKIATLWETYRSMGFDQSALKLQELPDEFKELFKQGKKLKGSQILKDGLPYLTNMANMQMDKAARLTVMLKALDDPSYLNRLGVKDVREAISKVMFDPDMLTTFEKNTVKKFIPFYTYAKNNMVYHITNMGQNGKKYNQLMKAMKGLQSLATDGNEENMSDFIKDNLYIPIPGIDKDGNYTVLRASLPFGQLLSTASNPLEELVSLATPAIKSPIELVLNKNTFSGSDIESFAGEKSQNIPFLTKKLEKIIGDFTGLDVPAKNISRILQGISEGLKGDQDLLSSIGEGLRKTVVMDNNVENDKLFKTYDEINQLEEIMKQYKQKGYTFATITELKQANKNDKLLGIEAIFNKYGITTGNTKYDELRKLLGK